MIPGLAERDKRISLVGFLAVLWLRRTIITKSTFMLSDPEKQSTFFCALHPYFKYQYPLTDSVMSESRFRKLALSFAALVGVISWLWTSYGSTESKDFAICDEPPYKVRILSYDPFMMHIENFLSQREIEHLLKKGSVITYLPINPIAVEPSWLRTVHHCTNGPEWTPRRASVQAEQVLPPLFPSKMEQRTASRYERPRSKDSYQSRVSKNYKWHATTFTNSTEFTMTGRSPGPELTNASQHSLPFCKLTASIAVRSSPSWWWTRQLMMIVGVTLLNAERMGKIWCRWLLRPRLVMLFIGGICWRMGGVMKEPCMLGCLLKREWKWDSIFGRGRIPLIDRKRGKKGNRDSGYRTPNSGRSEQCDLRSMAIAGTQPCMLSNGYVGNEYQCASGDNACMHQSM